ncbi:MAG: polymerase sigma70 factor [Flaviaesturariibacter sp.]|nr:polymerase sigma70 factor [Flaviaesturariibacter sp.]
MAFLKNIASSFTDEELVQRYRQTGDLGVLGSLYQRYMDLLYGVCLKYLAEPEDAKDAVLTIFEELIEKLKKHEVAHFRAWLYQLAKNHCLMRLRSEKGKTAVKMDLAFMQSEETAHLEEVFQKEAQLQGLEYCIEKLADEQRQVVELFYLQGKCYNEIVAISGLEWNNVRSAIQNGRRNLKICMEQQVKKSVM